MDSIEKMLEAELKINQFDHALMETGLVEFHLPELGLLDHVYDLIGFPEDNYCDRYRIPKTFCRDWLYDRWLNVVAGKITVKNYIAWLQKEVKEIS